MTIEWMEPLTTMPSPRTNPNNKEKDNPKKGLPPHLQSIITDSIIEIKHYYYPSLLTHHSSAQLLPSLLFTAMGEETKIFTLEEVSQHNSPKDCWLIVNGKVYDVTKFLDDHPGGDEVMLGATGKDATEDFTDVGHSGSAREMMNDFYVGDFDTGTIPLEQKYTPPKQPHYDHDKTSEFIIKLLQFLVPLAILGLAFAIRAYTKST